VRKEVKKRKREEEEEGKEVEGMAPSPESIIRFIILRGVRGAILLGVSRKPRLWLGRWR
jgi:hypothetical protein